MTRKLRLSKKQHPRKNVDIAFVISDMGSGGAQRVLTLLIDAWLKKGKKIALITFTSPKEDFYKVPKDVYRISIGHIGNSKSLATAIIANISRIFSLRKALKKTSSKNVISFITSTNILSILASINLKTNVIISERNDPSRQSYGLCWSVLRRLFYKQAAFVTANSTQAIATLANYVPRKKLHYIQNPFFPIKEKERTPIEKKEKIILSVGRLVPHKSQKTLIYAFSNFKKLPETEEWKLHIIGDGPEKGALLSLILQLKIEAHAKIIPATRDIDSYYKKSMLFVLPSLYEGTPNTILEAVAHGSIPIISSNCNGIRDVFGDSLDSLFFSAGSDVSLLEKLIYVTQHSSEYNALINLCKDALEKLHPDIVTLSWEKLIKI